MKREFLQSLTVGEYALPKEVVDAIMAENGKDIQLAKQAGKDWEEKYHKTLEDHEKEIKSLHLQNALQTAITRAGGRNLTAISALLDLESIQQQEDYSASLADAVEKLKQENSYLFYQTTVPYARGTGTAMPDNQPVSLADALRQRNETR